MNTTARGGSFPRSTRLRKVLAFSTPPMSAKVSPPRQTDRPGVSLSVKCLLRDGLLDEGRTMTDYGCGHGQDLVILAETLILTHRYMHIHVCYIKRY
jgi:hypothetical protein